MTMRGGWTMVASPARLTYVYAHGVSPLWLARVRRLLTEQRPVEDSAEPTFDIAAWRALEQWANEAPADWAPAHPAPVAAPIVRSATRKVMRRLRALPAEAEGA